MGALHFIAIDRIEDYLLAGLFFKSLNIFSLFLEIYRLHIQNAVNDSQNTIVRPFTNRAERAKLIAQIDIIVIVFIIFKQHLLYIQILL